ncbi:MAG: hypothetical protein ABSE73_11690, partial [Planctomycetota bacterium]
MATRRVHKLAAALALGALWLGAQAWSGDTQLQMFLPLGRNAYQINEIIHLAVVRSSAEALPAGDLSLTLSGDDGSKLAFTFPLEAVAAAAAPANEARSVTHLQLNGWLLRPGHYAVEAMFRGETAAAVSTPLDVCSHVRKSTFKLVDWGCPAKESEQAVLGE